MAVYHANYFTRETCLMCITNVHFICHMNMTVKLVTLLITKPLVLGVVIPVESVFLFFHCHRRINWYGRHKYYCKGLMHCCHRRTPLKAFCKLFIAVTLQILCLHCCHMRIKSLWKAQILLLWFNAFLPQENSLTKHFV